jgi:hypothetical protein
MGRAGSSALPRLPVRAGRVCQLPVRCQAANKDPNAPIQVRVQIASQRERACWVLGTWHRDAHLKQCHVVVLKRAVTLHNTRNRRTSLCSP